MKGQSSILAVLLLAGSNIIASPLQSSNKLANCDPDGVAAVFDAHEYDCEWAALNQKGPKEIVDFLYI